MSITEQQTGSDVVRDIVYLTYDKGTSSGIVSELAKAGYRTKITSSLGETILCLRQPKYAALIVGPLVQTADKSLLASELRRRSSKTKIVFLNRDGIQSSSEADAVISMHNGGDAIIRTLRRLLPNRQ